MARTNPDDVAVGRNVRIIRGARDLDVDTVAKQAGITPRLQRLVENGEAHADLATLRRIAEALDTTLGRLIDGPAPRRWIELDGLDDQAAGALESLAAALRRR